jgi:hypothetical protein
LVSKIEILKVFDKIRSKLKTSFKKYIENKSDNNCEGSDIHKYCYNNLADYF